MKLCLHCKKGSVASARDTPEIGRSFSWEILQPFEEKWLLVEQSNFQKTKSFLNGWNRLLSVESRPILGSFRCNIWLRSQSFFSNLPGWIISLYLKSEFFLKHHTFSILMSFSDSSRWLCVIDIVDKNWFPSHPPPPPTFHSWIKLSKWFYSFASDTKIQKKKSFDRRPFNEPFLN